MPQSVEKTISEVKDLLNSLDAVKVLRTQGNDEYIRIEFTIASFDSLNTLTHVSEMVHKRLHSWVHHKPGTTEAISDPARALHYHLIFKKDEACNEDAAQCLGYFGGWLAKQVYSKGIITISNANKLLRKWNVAEISE